MPSETQRRPGTDLVSPLLRPNGPFHFPGAIHRLLGVAPADPSAFSRPAGRGLAAAGFEYLGANPAWPVESPAPRTQHGGRAMPHPARVGPPSSLDTAGDDAPRREAPTPRAPGTESAGSPSVGPPGRGRPDPVSPPAMPWTHRQTRDSTAPAREAEREAPQVDPAWSVRLTLPGVAPASSHPSAPARRADAWPTAERPGGATDGIGSRAAARPAIGAPPRPTRHPTGDGTPAAPMPPGAPLVGSAPPTHARVPGPGSPEPAAGSSPVEAASRAAHHRPADPPPRSAPPLAVHTLRSTGQAGRLVRLERLRQAGATLAAGRPGGRSRHESFVPEESAAAARSSAPAAPPAPAPPVRPRVMTLAPDPPGGAGRMPRAFWTTSTMRSLHLRRVR